MMLLLSKVASVIILPLGFFFLAVLAAGTMYVIGYRRLSRAAIVSAVVMLWAASTPAFAKLLLSSLEGQFPAIPIIATPFADVAILLGGTTEPSFPPRQRPDLLRTADRIFQAAGLYRAGKVRWIIASGGELPWSSATNSEAQRMAQVLMELGVPESAIILDDKSRTTWENGLLAAEIMMHRNFHSGLIVTSANHMPRAMAVFKKLGLTVTASPTDFIVAGPFGRSLLDWLPDSEALNNTHKATKEFVGYFAYWARGWV